MAAPSLDPLTMTNWEDAFQQPIVNVRAMERQLRGSLDANKEKLRALVGYVWSWTLLHPSPQIHLLNHEFYSWPTPCSESYRDLLGTAERIIEMDTSIRQVETHLAETTRNCNYRRLEKKASNLIEFKGKISARGKASWLDELKADLLIKILQTGRSLYLLLNWLFYKIVLWQYRGWSVKRTQDFCQPRSM